MPASGTFLLTALRFLTQSLARGLRVSSHVLGGRMFVILRFNRIPLNVRCNFKCHISFTCVCRHLPIVYDGPRVAFRGHHGNVTLFFTLLNVDLVIVTEKRTPSRHTDYRRRVSCSFRVFFFVRFS